MEIKPNVICLTKGLVIDAECNDMLVEVMEFVPSGHIWTDPDGRTWMDYGGIPCWAVVSIGSNFPASSNSPESKYSIFAPRNLRPIRDPGDDAVDEFLALTGKPDYKEKIAEKMNERV
jgi:hypothetical protein